MQKNKFKASCVILMISQKESDRFGYNKVINYPFIAYTKNSEFEQDKERNESFYYKSGKFTLDDRFIFIPNYLIEKKISFEEAREIYPELFL